MDIGLGLPISNPARLPEWARRADDAGFSTLALLDRLAFSNPEPLVTLATLAGATRRIALQTEVLLGPLRSTALLAKQVATLDVVSGGRFRLGIGVGGRDDDHRAAGTPLERRGADLDRQLADLARIWRQEPYSADPSEPGSPVGPAPTTPGGPPILIGGFAPRALARVARHGDGFICAAPLEWAGPLIDSVRRDWRDAGRAGRPRIVCQANVAFGPSDTLDEARTALADYYAFTGRPGWGSPVTDEAQLTDTIQGCAALGADELILYCWADQPDQIDRLAPFTG